MRIILTILTACLLALPAAAQHDHGSHDESGQKPAKGDKAKLVMPTEFGAQTTCPISGEELEDRETYLEYEGHRIYVCCKKCKRKAKAKPEQVAMEMFVQGILLENLQTMDPVSGEELETKEHFHQIYNKRIYVNDAKDLEKVSADPARYLDILGGRTAQEKCAVRGGDLDPDADFVIEGMTVGQCCPGCEKKWFAEPSAFFAKMEEAKVVLEPATMICPLMPGMDGSKAYPVTLGAKRYYLCSEKAAVMFVRDTGKYLPKWYAAQAKATGMAPASGGGHGHH